MRNRHLVVIAGPTAVGKTRAAILLAEILGTDIISADSRQIYKELHIGTAVPGSSRQKRVKHHLLQHVSIREYYNASMFEIQALKVLEHLFQTKETAILCGGSGLYIRGVCQGIDERPSVDPAIREDLQQKLKSEGLESMQNELKRLDPLYYDQVDLKNPSRVLRALEISIMTGKPYSSFLTGSRKPRDFRIIKIGLNLGREELYNRINHRVDGMMENGLLDEVRSMLAYRGSNALKTVGYRELFDHLDGKTSLQEAVSLIKRNTRRYARRQITWFMRDNEMEWFHPSRTDEIIHHIRRHAETKG